MIDMIDMEAYFNHIRADFAKWMRGTSGDETSQRTEESIREFCDSLSFEVGNKYIKVTKNSGCNPSVHSFIVLKDTGKFRRGDILKAASWRAPATNFARGNVIEGTLDRVTWTGAI